MRRGNNKHHLILSSALFVLLVAPACLADLMCYVCDDCDKVTKETPLLACNADFFNQGGSTEASTVTTTTSTTSTTTTEAATEVSTTTVGTTVQDTTETSTSGEPSSTELLTTEPPSTESSDSTEPPIPTPATAGPPETTTGVPTPPAEDLAKITRLLPSFDVDETASSTQMAVRQRRALIDTSVSYHCYTVQKSINNTHITNRGCSRVDAQQSVCEELKAQSNDIQLDKCDPCTMNACNGATSMVQSSLLAALIFSLVAAALQRN